MPFVKWTGFGVAFVWLAVELPAIQRIVGTVSLSSLQWLVVALLAFLAPTVVEIDKAVRRRASRRAVAEPQPT